MADISKINVPINGTATTYNIKDATARARHLYIINAIVEITMQGSVQSSIYLTLPWRYAFNDTSHPFTKDSLMLLKGMCLTANGLLGNSYPLIYVKFDDTTSNIDGYVYYQNSGLKNASFTIRSVTGSSYQIY